MFFFCKAVIFIKKIQPGPSLGRKKKEKSFFIIALWYRPLLRIKFNWNKESLIRNIVLTETHSLSSSTVGGAGDTFDTFEDLKVLALSNPFMQTSSEDNQLFCYSPLIIDSHPVRTIIAISNYALVWVKIMPWYGLELCPGRVKIMPWYGLELCPGMG